MATKKKMLQAAAGNATGGAGGLNVEDVFSTYLYEGNGSSQVIENGIALGDNAEAAPSNTEPSSLRSGTVDGFFVTVSSYGVFNTASAGENLTVTFSSEVVITQATYLNAVGTDWAPTEVLIQSSDDGVSWTTRHTHTDANNMNLQTITISGGGSGKYWRMYQNTATRNGGSGYEWHMNNFSMSGVATEAGEGGLVWTKGRTQTVEHILVDTERGVQKYLSSDRTNAEGTNSGILNSFNYNGFSIGGSSFVNSSGNDYASWTFRKAPKFFTCVEYTGTGSTGNTVSHSLGTTVGSIIIKRINNADDWCVYHRSDGATTSKFYRLNTSGAQDDFGVDWITVTQNDFTLNVTSSKVNAPANYVAYLFAHNDGDGEFGPNADQDIIKCGSYSQSSASDVDVDLGFEPQFVIVKRSDDTSQWYILDEMRGFLAGSNSTSSRTLYASLANAEADFTIQKTATGFTWPSGQYGSGTQEYIYIAIRRGTKVPESANEVFAIDTRSATNPSFTSNFVTDFALARDASQTWEWVAAQRLTQGKIFEGTNDTDAEYSSSSFNFDYQAGYGNLGSANSNYYGWMWKRAPGFFDAVAFSGTGSARTVSHNLGVAPEMMWVKERSQAENWRVYHKDVGTDAGLSLNLTSGEIPSTTFWNNTAPTDTVLSVNSNSTNESGQTYIAYLFASLDNISKVGSFTISSGQSSVVDCGFSSGARFVLMKRYDGSDYWWVFDTERGITVSSSPGLRLDNTNPESSDTYLTPNSSGFATVAGYFPAGDYIFYAIA